MEVDYSKQPGLIPSSPANEPYRDQDVPVHSSPNHPYTQDPKYGPQPGDQPSIPTGEYGYGGVAASSSDRRILGLRATTFWLLVALVVVVIAAAVGGGVGGSMAVNNAKTSCLSSAAAAAAASASSKSSSVPSTTTASSSSTGTTTSTSASTTQWGPIETTEPYSGCPGNNGTKYTSYFPNTQFKIFCGLDIPFTSTSDLLYLITPTFELCMEACSSWNDNGKANGGVQTTCQGAAFIPSHINGDGAGMPADCVLKSGANLESELTPNPSYVVDSGLLQ